MPIRSTGDQYGPPDRAYATSVEQQRQNARDKIYRLANVGKDLSSRFDDAFFHWAFGGDQAAIDAAFELAQQRRVESAARADARAMASALPAMTERVLEEQDAERRREAEAEARRRLGIEAVDARNV